jgi:NADH-quinone oxidoreductase subunit J
MYRGNLAKLFMRSYALPLPKVNMEGLFSKFGLASGTSGTLAPVALAQTALPILSPLLVLVLCVFAGIGTYLLLPSRRDISFRRIGAAMLAAGLLILVALVLRLEAGMNVYFWIFAGIALVGAVRVITHPRPVYSALYFVLTVFASAGLFVLLQAEFIAAALVLIYAGAILITYLFVIMLTAQSSSGGPVALASDYDAVSREPLIGSVVGFALMGLLLFVIFDRAGGLTPQTPMTSIDADIAATHGGTQQLGVYLFKHQTVSLELAGLILTISMVGAIVIARKRVVYHEASAASQPDMVLASATPVDDSPFSIPVYGTTAAGQKAYPEH